jgi:hypothetical protein
VLTTDRTRYQVAVPGTVALIYRGHGGCGLRTSRTVQNSVEPKDRRMSQSYAKQISPSITNRSYAKTVAPIFSIHITNILHPSIISVVSASVVQSQLFCLNALPRNYTTWFVSSYSSLTGLIENVERDDVLSDRLPVLPLLRGV